MTEEMRATSSRQFRERPLSLGTCLQRQLPAHGTDPQDSLALRGPPEGRCPRSRRGLLTESGAQRVAPPSRLYLRVPTSGRRTDSADEMAAPSGKRRPGAAMLPASPRPRPLYGAGGQDGGAWSRSRRPRARPSRS